MNNVEITMTYRWPALVEGLRCGEPEHRLCKVAWLRSTCEGMKGEGGKSGVQSTPYRGAAGRRPASSGRLGGALTCPTFAGGGLQSSWRSNAERIPQGMRPGKDSGPSGRECGPERIPGPSGPTSACPRKAVGMAPGVLRSRNMRAKRAPVATEETNMSNGACGRRGRDYRSRMKNCPRPRKPVIR